MIEAGPLQSQHNEQARIPLDAIKAARTQYQKLFLDKMRAPDGGYEDGVIIPGTRTSPPRTERTGGNLDLNNPLSLHNEVRLASSVIVVRLRQVQNPWTAWFAAMELRKTILQDVERTYVRLHRCSCSHTNQSLDSLTSNTFETRTYKRS